MQTFLLAIAFKSLADHTIHGDVGHGQQRRLARALSSMVMESLRGFLHRHPGWVRFSLDLTLRADGGHRAPSR